MAISTMYQGNLLNVANHLAAAEEGNFITRMLQKLDLKLRNWLAQVAGDNYGRIANLRSTWLPIAPAICTLTTPIIPDGAKKSVARARVFLYKKPGVREGHASKSLWIDDEKLLATIQKQHPSMRKRNDLGIVATHSVDNQVILKDIAREMEVRFKESFLKPTPSAPKMKALPNRQEVTSMTTKVAEKATFVHTGDVRSNERKTVENNVPVVGELISHGHDVFPYAKQKAGQSPSTSYFVLVKDDDGFEHDFWGVGLQTVVERAEVGVGDRIRIVKLGQVKLGGDKGSRQMNKFNIDKLST